MTTPGIICSSGRMRLIHIPGIHIYIKSERFFTSTGIRIKCTTCRANNSEKPVPRLCGIREGAGDYGDRTYHRDCETLLHCTHSTTPIHNEPGYSSVCATIPAAIPKKRFRAEKSDEQKRT